MSTKYRLQSNIHLRLFAKAVYRRSQERIHNQWPDQRTLKNSTAQKGRLMNASEIAEEFFGGTRSPQWVRRNIPGKKTLGHSTVRWFREDIVQLLKQQSLES